MKYVESEKVGTEIYSATFKARLPCPVVETFDYDSMGGTAWHSHTKTTFTCFTSYRGSSLWFRTRTFSSSISNAYYMEDIESVCVQRMDTFQKWFSLRLVL